MLFSEPYQLLHYDRRSNSRWFSGHMSRPEADATPLTGLLQGLQASIAQLTQASLSQTEAFKNLK